MNDLVLTGGRSGRSHIHSMRDVATGMLRWMRRCHARASQRASLADLDPRLLRDIGVSEAERMMESEKPFWR